MAYRENVAYAFIKLSAKSYSFNILYAMDVLAALLLLQKIAHSCIIGKAIKVKRVNKI